MIPDISICIPCYEMGGHGHIFLNKSLSIISDQTDVDFSKIEIVVSDHSKDDLVKQCCDTFKELKIKYVKNEKNRGSMADNTNNCIRNSSGKYIKPLYQDDYLYSKNSLKCIINNLNDNWIAHEYTHLDLSTDTFYNQRTPFYNDRMIDGVNTIGPPSSVIFKNDGDFFDENLIWFIDTEFYYRMNQKYGMPTILKSNTPLTVVTTWSGQTTNTKITPLLIDKETTYVKLKHENNFK
jgi:glycosyltransferase involved in cell wall biosynthesis